MERTPEDAKQQATFAALLRAFRLSAGIGQEALAERARLSPQAVSALERGVRLRPYPATVASLADALGLSAHDRTRLERSASLDRAPRGFVGKAQFANHNLPAERTSLIGRDREIEEIAELLEHHRLVTVCGSGGVGKTRVALRVAQNLQEARPDGVWFVELAPLSNGELIPSTIAQAMKLRLQSKGERLCALASAMRRMRVLVVLDNCEHLVADVAPTVEKLLANCPHVVVLTTSRQGLEITGEATYRLPSLGVQDGVKLFASRAADAESTFVLGDENVPTIAEICRRLDGIPLAIELAAARVRILSPRQLGERLDERFRVLTGGKRDALPRQQTLRALISWSHDLLGARERMLFRRLAIFVNGFTLEGAVAVGRGNDFDDLDVVDALSSLVNQSLVLAEPAGETLRYRLLESTRIYALEMLVAAGERELSARHHLGYVHDRFVRAREQYETTASSAELDGALATELDNVRATLDHALKGADAPLGGKLLAEIGWNWSKLELASEGLTRVQAFLAILPEADHMLLARLSTASSLLAVSSYRMASGFAAATQAVAHAGACHNAQTLAEALDVFSYAAARLRRYDEAEAAIRQAEALNDISPALRLRMLQTRAFVSWRHGDLSTAAHVFERLRNDHHSLGNTFDERIMALNLAEVEHARGQTQRAIALVREVLYDLEAHSDRTLLIKALANLAGYLCAVDDFSGARAAALEAIAEFAAHEPESIRVAMAMEHLALTCAVTGELRRAAHLVGYVDANFKAMGFARQYTEATTHDRLLALLHEGLRSDELARLLVEGAALTPEASVALALEEQIRFAVPTAN